MMRTTASLNLDQAPRKIHEEDRQLVSAELLLHQYLAVLADSVGLEHVLCQVDAHSRKLHGGHPSRYKLLIDVVTLAGRCRFGSEGRFDKGCKCLTRPLCRPFQLARAATQQQVSYQAFLPISLERNACATSADAGVVALPETTKFGL
jgi:hypothetical protein